MGTARGMGEARGATAACSRETGRAAIGTRWQAQIASFHSAPGSAPDPRAASLLPAVRTVYGMMASAPCKQAAAMATAANARRIVPEVQLAPICGRGCWTICEPVQIYDPAGLRHSFLGR